MSVASRKAKGRRFQQAIIRVLKEKFTSLTGNDLASTAMGVPGVDIQLSPKALQVLPYEFELKCCEKISIWAVINQALKRHDPSASTTPCIILGKNRTSPIAVVPLGEWLNLHGYISSRPLVKLSDLATTTENRLITTSATLQALKDSRCSESGAESIIDLASRLGVRKSIAVEECERVLLDLIPIPLLFQPSDETLIATGGASHPQLKVWYRSTLNIWNVYNSIHNTVSSSKGTKTLPVKHSKAITAADDHNLEHSIFNSVPPTLIFGRENHYLFATIPLQSFINLAFRRYCDD